MQSRKVENLIAEVRFNKLPLHLTLLWQRLLHTLQAQRCYRCYHHSRRYDPDPLRGLDLCTQVIVLEVVSWPAKKKVMMLSFTSVRRSPPAASMAPSMSRGAAIDETRRQDRSAKGAEQRTERQPRAGGGLCRGADRFAGGPQQASVPE
jgi:hypothetical protein